MRELKGNLLPSHAIKTAQITTHERPGESLRPFRHPVLPGGQEMTDGTISHQCFLDPMLVQVPLRQRGVFTSRYRSGRTGDQKTSRRFYRWKDLRSRRQQLMAEAPCRKNRSRECVIQCRGQRTTPNAQPERRACSCDSWSGPPSRDSGPGKDGFGCVVADHWASSRAG